MKTGVEYQSHSSAESRTQTDARTAIDDADRKRERQLKQLGINISKIREDRKYTQIEFAYRLGLTGPAHLSRIESGTKTPNLMLLLKMADLLDVRIQEFFVDV